MTIRRSLLDSVDAKASLTSWTWRAAGTGLTALCILGLALVADHFLWNYALRDTSRDRLGAMDRDAFLMESRLRGRANDMFFLKRVAEQELAQNPQQPVGGANLATAITSMMLARSQYDQIHLLDLSGHEISRYNWVGGANPVQAVAPKDLQDKSGRPYYRETLEAAPNAAVFSPLDLNVENGSIEQPLKPVIRVSGQIVGPDGQVKALLVLNYLGDNLLRELKSSNSPSCQTLLLNADGYWLMGPTPESEWAFMLPERMNGGGNLHQEDPALWKRVTAHKSGWFEQDGNLYCFLNTDPTKSEQDYPPLRMPIKGGDRLRWTIVEKTPDAAVWRNVHGIRTGMWLGFGGSFMVLVPMVWFGILSMQRRRIAVRELRESQQRLLQSLAQEQELVRRAQGAERAKGEFLAAMSHEIRTPMNGVVGMASILADTELTEGQRDYVNSIQTSGEALLSVIGDILDFSKIESGKMALEQHPFNLRQCVEDAVDLFAVQLRSKGLEAAYLVDRDIPARLIGDSARLRQILINLLGNAIKFTERGEITLTVRRRREEGPGDQLLFSVTDTGIGISDEARQRLFQSFQQGDSSTTRRYGGSGLGLVISRQLAEMMGGKMWVESKPGSGSTFSFTIALQPGPVDGNPDPSQELPEFKDRAVLLVEGNAVLRQFLEAQLQVWGLPPVSAASAQEAREKMKGRTFDAILLDRAIPDWDGIALAREIRRSSQVPLVLLSSSGRPETGETADLFKYQISKPIRHSVLWNALRHLVGGHARVLEKAKLKQFDREMAQRHPLRILLAEDNVINQKVSLLMLSRLGYLADLAVNGLKVLESTDKNHYEVIFMDIQMPDMDGVEATRLLREKLGDRCPYLVALTANAMQDDRAKFLGLGFDAYLSKPLSPEALRAILQTVPVVTGLNPSRAEQSA